MPEGDTLRAIASRLEPIVGDVVRVEAVHPRARVLRIAERLDGRRLTKIEAQGKNLLLSFAPNLVLRSHLMMKGRWRIRPLADDERAGGQPWLRITGRTHEATQWNGPILKLGNGHLPTLGPDVLDAPTPFALLFESLRATAQDRPLQDVLLDQRVVAGIGNVWRSEILFLAGVSPQTTLEALSDHELRELVRVAASAMGTGRRRANVYRRTGRPCPRCGGTISARRVGEHARTVYWCGGCQAGNMGRSA